MGDGTEVDVSELEQMARRCRVDIVKMTHAAKSGHPGGVTFGDRLYGRNLRDMSSL